MITTYNDELLRRQEFAASFNGHFLCNLFPGMNDVPPSYATEQPSEFDSSLPKISKKGNISLLFVSLKFLMLP